MPYGLTQRELEVLRVVARSNSDTEAANSLFMAPEHLAVHLKNIAAKMGVETHEEAVDRARTEGLL